jgi:hypothetical protein
MGRQKQTENGSLFNFDQAVNKFIFVFMYYIIFLLIWAIIWTQRQAFWLGWE